MRTNHRLSFGLFLWAIGCGVVDPSTLAKDPPPDAAQSGALPPHCIYLEPVSGSAILCKGTFPAGGAAELCPPQYSVCTAAYVLPPNLYQKCAELSSVDAGVYLVDIVSSRSPSNPSQATCTQVAGWQPSLQICGNDPGSILSACSGWPRSMVCAQSSSFACSGGIQTASNSNAKNGVACCK